MALELSHNEDIDMGMYDIKNSGWPLEVFGAEEYPVIIYFTTKNKEGIKYEGSKDLKEILGFIKQHTTYPTAFNEALFNFQWIW